MKIKKLSLRKNKQNKKLWTKRLIIYIKEKEFKKITYSLQKRKQNQNIVVLIKLLVIKINLK